METPIDTRKTGRPASDNQTPEQKAKADYMREWYRQRGREATRRYNAKPEAKVKRRAYRKLPHVRAKEREAQRRTYAKVGRANSRQRKCEVKRQYGITVEEYDRRKAEQNGRCAICEQEAFLYMDHDHATGQVRKFLCTSCNNGLGRFKDKPELLRRAADYLEGRT